MKLAVYQMLFSTDKLRLQTVDEFLSLVSYRRRDGRNKDLSQP